MRRLVACLALSILASAPAAAAPITYDNGAPDGGTWSVDQGYLLADDFVFPVDTLLTGILGWSGDSWMILEGDTTPVALVATGLMTDPISLPLMGGKRYWVGVLNGTLTDPCNNSAMASTTARNSTLSAHYMSYPAGPLFPGDPECAAPEGYNFTIWGTDDLPSEGLDFAFELQGQTIPEPASPILFGIGMLAMGLQRKVRGRRRVR
jgi:hypothetical protein